MPGSNHMRRAKVTLARRKQIYLGLLCAFAILVGLLYWFVKGDDPFRSGQMATYMTGELLSFELHPPQAALLTTSFLKEDGSTTNLEAYRGKVILLNLWATWCAPCLHEMPTLDRLQGAMGSDDFEVLAVSVDRGELEKSALFLRRTGAEHLDLLVDETQKLNFDFKAYQLPTTLLLDREGREIGRIAGDVVWDSPEVKAFLTKVIEKTAPAPDEMTQPG